MKDFLANKISLSHRNSLTIHNLIKFKFSPEYRSAF